MIYRNISGLYLFAAALLCSVSFFMAETFAQGVLSCIGSNADTNNSTVTVGESSLNSLNNSKMQDDFENWKVISGTWNQSSLLEGGTGSNSTNSVENIIISPAVFENISEIKTSFKVNEAHPNLSSYIYIIYSYLDPDHFKMAGLHEENNEIFVRFVEIVDGCLTAEPN